MACCDIKCRFAKLLADRTPALIGSYRFVLDPNTDDSLAVMPNQSGFAIGIGQACFTISVLHDPERLMFRIQLVDWVGFEWRVKQFCILDWFARC